MSDQLFTIPGKVYREGNLLGEYDLAESADDGVTLTGQQAEELLATYIVSLIRGGYTVTYSHLFGEYKAELSTATYGGPVVEYISPPTPITSNPTPEA